MDTGITQSIALNLQKDWELQLPGSITEAELLELLAAKISYLVEKQRETFFQLMYRLDIPEKKLNAILGDMDAIDKIARLVYDRQLEKARSRQQHKASNDDIEENLKW